MSRVTIVAEAGVNHNGDLKIACQLIDVAAACGADYVKFQTFKAEKLVTKDASKADYQILNTGEDSSQFSMLKALELSEHDHYTLLEHCRKAGIKFLSTAFDEESVDFLDSLGIDFFKIPSGEITNLPYLEKIASKGKPVVISTGMATMEEVYATVNVFVKAGISKDNLTVLHCTTEYPTPYEDVNLKAMVSMADALGLAVGYSDHTEGIEVAIASVAVGAVFIEKHFTLDRKLPGPDHKASLEPTELSRMVTSIRNIEQALAGDGIKKPSPSEAKNKEVARKSIYLREARDVGDVLSENDLIMLRPGNGISPMALAGIVGRKLSRSLPGGHQLRMDDVI